ncbi:MAG: SOS response-associated peptidase [Oscillospiraceae bacterium]
MCGRYYFDDGNTELRSIINQIKQNNNLTRDLAQLKTGEVFPTDIVPALTQDAPLLMKWGFARFDGKGQVINARIETAGEKPMFRREYAARRCLIPASCYFEWDKSKAPKQKYSIGLQHPIYMAGLYRYEGLSPTPLFVILTRPAERGISFIHTRMPVILPAELQDKWLSGKIDVPEILDISAGDLKYGAV